MKLTITRTGSQQQPFTYSSLDVISIGTAQDDHVQLNFIEKGESYALLFLEDDQINLRTLKSEVFLVSDEGETPLSAHIIIELESESCLKIGSDLISFKVESSFGNFNEVSSQGFSEESMEEEKSIDASRHAASASVNVSTKRKFAEADDQPLEDIAEQQSPSVFPSSQIFSLVEGREFDKDEKFDRRLIPNEQAEVSEAFSGIADNYCASTSSQSSILPAQRCAKIKITVDGYQEQHFNGAKGSSVLRGSSASAAQSTSKPIAKINVVFRYMNCLGAGALKYGPISCSKIEDFDACQNIRSERVKGQVSFTFKVLLEPGARYTQTEPKLIPMVVPTIGCPSDLKDLIKCRAMLWSSAARERPTYLVVSHLEGDIYMQQLGLNLKQLGVGIISWSTKKPLYGFGVCRLAAQTAAENFGGNCTIDMCDVNVLDPSLKNGHQVDKVKFAIKKKAKSTVDAKVLGTAWYTSTGKGSGIPLLKFDGYTLSKLPSAGIGGGGRPIEQVITIGDELLFDPCFITSSEDMDMTEQFLHEQNWSRTKVTVHKGKELKDVKPLSKMKYASFKDKMTITKVLFDQGPLTHEYMIKRNEYLMQLSNEGSYIVSVPKLQLDREFYDRSEPGDKNSMVEDEGEEGQEQEDEGGGEGEEGEEGEEGGRVNITINALVDFIEKEFNYRIQQFNEKVDKWPANTKAKKPEKKTGLDENFSLVLRSLIVEKILLKLKIEKRQLEYQDVMKDFI